ncbi:uncharacterized protein [Ptychodera flava]|uniref:uncharacterized protein n=1 Tax=Ptychodera flava TaxID=63121 RepID=UPI00396A3D6E
MELLLETSNLIDVNKQTFDRLKEEKFGDPDVDNEADIFIIPGIPQAVMKPLHQLIRMKVNQTLVSHRNNFLIFKRFIDVMYLEEIIDSEAAFLDEYDHLNLSLSRVVEKIDTVLYQEGFVEDAWNVKSIAGNDEFVVLSNRSLRYLRALKVLEGLYLYCTCTGGAISDFSRLTLGSRNFRDTRSDIIF